MYKISTYHIEADVLVSPVGVVNALGYDAEGNIVNAGSIVTVPNGIITVGGADVNGNDIEYDNEWIWVINGVSYSPNNSTVLNFPNASSGQRRLDIVYGNNQGEILKLEGDSFPDDGPAVAKPLPSGTILLQTIDVRDTGIEEVQQNAISTFVRFDISTQGLSPEQRQNARTNIQTVAKDRGDVIKLTTVNQGNARWDFVDNDDLTNLRIRQSGQGSESLVLIEMFNQSGNRTLRFLNGVPQTGLGSNSPQFHLRGHGTGTRTLVTWTDGNNDAIFSMLASGISRFFNHAPIQPRSSTFERSVRRDELPLLYTQNITGEGKLNNIEINPDTKLINLTTTIEEISGIDADGNQRELILWSNNQDGVTLTEQDTDSNASNRFAFTTHIPYRVPVKIIYRSNTNRWYLMSGGNGNGGGGFPSVLPEYHILIGNDENEAIPFEVEQDSILGRLSGGIENILFGDEWVNVPATATSIGMQGQKAIDSDFIYFCYDTNLWVRTAIDTSWV